MMLDELIAKYGTHELDVDLCKTEGETTTVYAYCHQHDVDGQFMVNHYLKIVGKIIPILMDVEDKTDIWLHIASIEKLEDEMYEISGVGGNIRFYVVGGLAVEEISEQEYDERG